MDDYEADEKAVEAMKLTFDKYDEEYLRFDLIENKRHRRPDLHAFLLLDELDPQGRDIVSGADHDEIYLDAKVETVAKVITDEQVLELVRCGIRYDESNDCFCSFV